MTVKRLSPQELHYLFSVIKELQDAVAREKIAVRQPDNPLEKFNTNGTGTKPLNDFLRKRRSGAV
jgi:hypothetical protein